MARHPVLVAAFFGALTGVAGFQAFRAGVTYGDLCRAVADDARVANEALGG
jgi:hypothetical protein